MSHPHPQFVRRIIGFVLILAFGIGVMPFAQAQDRATATPSTISITGTIESVNATGIVVSGITVEFGSASVAMNTMIVGATVEVTGVMTNGVIVATSIIVVVEDSEITATPSPVTTVTATFTPDPNMTPTPKKDFNGTIIVIEGPITKIDIDIHVITIFDIDIHVREDDPILKKVKLGDKLRVLGNLDLDGDTIIIIAINITIINIIVVDVPNPRLPSGCKISKKGKIKCSRK